MVRRKILNPLTGRMIYKDGQTAKLLRNDITSLNEEGNLYKHKKGKYKNINSKLFCGPSGNAPEGTFPVNTEKRCRSALTYAHTAPYPKGIEKCAIKIAKKQCWKCGVSSKKLKKNKIKPSTGKCKK